MPDGIELREPYQAAKQQHDADMLGMCVFLATEIMLFGGLIAAILIIRVEHPAEYIAASSQLHVWIGAINTAVLLTSSLAVALAAGAARAGLARLVALLFAGAVLLGIVFLGLKAFEYSLEAADGLLPLFSKTTRFSGPVEHLFMNFYLIATGLHAIHVSVGVLLLGGLALRVAMRGLRLPERAATVEITGLYWHLVDIIWIFLYPILYLAR